MNKKSLLTLVASSALATTTLALGSGSASAFCTGLPSDSVSGATACAPSIAGNDSEAELNLIEVDPFGGIDWVFKAKIEAPDTMPTEGLDGAFTLTYDQDPEDSTTGTYTIDPVISGDGPFVFVLKTGPAADYYYLPEGTFTGDWSTIPALEERGLSHATLYMSAMDGPKVPEPSSVLGLLAFGLIGANSALKGKLRK